MAARSISRPIGIFVAAIAVAFDCCETISRLPTRLPYIFILIYIYIEREIYKNLSTCIYIRLVFPCVQWLEVALSNHMAGNSFLIH